MNGYQDIDRNNPSPINHRENLIALYDLIAEGGSDYAIYFETLISDICKNPEGIYIVANYLDRIVRYFLDEGLNVPVDYQKLHEILNKSIQENLISLNNTSKIKRLSLSGNVFQELVSLNQKHFNDTGTLLIENNSILITPTKDVMIKVQKNVLDEMKTPHSVSYPVLRRDDDTLYLAVFVFFYDRDEVENCLIGRPTTWITLDLFNGDLLKVFKTKQKEFSDALYNLKYDVNLSSEHSTSTEYYELAYNILDSVRGYYLESGEIRTDDYEEYLRRILSNTLKEYRRFYRDLSTTE